MQDDISGELPSIPNMEIERRRCAKDKNQDPGVFEVIFYSLRTVYVRSR